MGGYQFAIPLPTHTSTSHLPCFWRQSHDEIVVIFYHFLSNASTCNLYFYTILPSNTPFDCSSTSGCCSESSVIFLGRCSYRALILLPFAQRSFFVLTKCRHTRYELWEQGDVLGWVKEECSQGCFKVVTINFYFQSKFRFLTDLIALTIIIIL